MKITVVGTGYVGLSLAVLLSRKYKVVAYDIVEEKVNCINQRISPIRDEKIDEFFATKKLNLVATLNYKEAFLDACFIIICTPTNYDEEKNIFDTSSIESTIEKILEVNKKATIVIKSTIPVGYVASLKEKYSFSNIFFSPEFLREGKALYDNLYPSRIIVGSKTKKAKEFAEILKRSAFKRNIPIKYMNSNEAEAVKLFSNTYLALRVSYFNELDTYAELHHLNTKDIIDGVCLDPRIGDHYNNPSFGYGGYCLPKDTKQLLANYKNVPQNIIEAVVKSNDTRKKHIAEMILLRSPKIVGVYRLTMKKDSDNFRFSAIFSIIQYLKEKNVSVMIYEPTIVENTFCGFEVVHDFTLFKKDSDVILANRMDDSLKDVLEKLYSRDVFFRD